jgi:RNA polymerase sigma-70 factor, ECF subfamily
VVAIDSTSRSPNRAEKEATAGGQVSHARFSSPEALYQAHHVRLVRVLSLLADDPEEAADAVQEAFVQLFLHWDKVRVYEDQAGWVRRVAINRLSNRRRSLRRKAAVLLRLRTNNAEAGTAPRDSSELAAAVLGLPTRQRQVILLHYVEDLSLAEIATSLDISKGAVSQHLRRGREALRKKLEAQDG